MEKSDPYKGRIRKFNPATIDLCISLIEDQYSQEWQKIAVNEAGPPLLPKEQYAKLWYPIRQMLYKQNITDNSIDLTALIIGVRSKFCRRLDLSPPKIRQT